MLKKIIITTILILTIAAIAVFWGVQKGKNKENIVVLGDGWKSYSHKEIGITVKIPTDAEINFGKTGEDKKDRYTAKFSKGIILSSGSLLKAGIEDPNNRSRIYSYHRSFGDCKNEWKVTKNGNRSRSFCKEDIIDNKIVIFPFSEYENITKNTLMLRIRSVSVLGKKRNHYLSLDQSYFTVTKELTQEHPHLTQEEVEKITQEFMNEIRDRIISINNF